MMRDFSLGQFVRIGNGDIAWTIERFFHGDQGQASARLRSGLTDRTRIEPLNRLSPWRASEQAHT